MQQIETHIINEQDKGKSAPQVALGSVPSGSVSRTAHMAWTLGGGMFVLLFAVLPLEHTPGMRNLLCVVLGLFGLWRIAVEADQNLPVRAWVIGLWIVWASASYFWSVAPDSTFAALKHDLWIPALALIGAYRLFSGQSQLDLLLWAVAAGTATNGFAIFFGLPTSPFSLALARYYVSTVAYASTCALVFVAIALPWLFDAERPRLRAMAVLVVLINVGIGLMVESRAFIVSTVLLLVFAFGMTTRRRRRRSVYIIAAAVIALIVAFAVVNRDRTALFTGQSDIVAGIDHVLTDEVRFAIWRQWEDHIARGPAMGVGFGRDVPPMTMTPAERQTLSEIDGFAAMHAHNVFLNILAETGWPGLVLFLAMLVQVTRHFVLATRSHDDATSRAGVTGLLLVTAMLLKNQTDVLMVFGPAVLFYAALGGLLAWPRDPRSSS